ncbi:hypothetical protein KKF91_12800 [Myxococcota bacterium]|nr:hypothetical protein [Myxococcota bacterium]MBU1431413.1 hypothetical protein [Myxococcota bacterium]MBU1897821.1 hypothetical protein [Myxococcota bacterium]
MARALILLPALLLWGCEIIKEEYPDGLRELRSAMKVIELRAAEGGAEVEFTYHYELGIVDEAGIADLQWRYALFTRDEAVLAEHSQRMREGEPDKTKLLVMGDRERRLEIPHRLSSSETYILWIFVDYRGERLGELLTGIKLGQRIEDNTPSIFEVDGGLSGILGITGIDGGLSAYD